MLNTPNSKQKRYFIISFSFLLVYLLIGTNFSVLAKQESQNTPLKPGRIIYVDADASPYWEDGSREHPYMYINNGLHVAHPGDTIFVFNGTYIEDLFVTIDNITLMGESNEKTILKIDAGWTLYIMGDHVTVTGFAFYSYIFHFTFGKINVTGDFCTISNNLFIDASALHTQCGIQLYNSTGSIITDNTICPDYDLSPQIAHAIKLENCYNTTIKNNYIGKYILGILISSSENNFIDGNDMHSPISLSNSNNNIVEHNHLRQGCWLWNSCYNKISLNNITNPVNDNWEEMGLYTSSNNTITKNNFNKYSTLRKFRVKGSQVYFLDSKNTFDMNFWGRARLLPKIMLGFQTVNGKQHYSAVQIDRHPAWKPYSIPSINQ